MLNTYQIEATREMQDSSANIARLDREIGMLKMVQPNLHGCAASQNRKRIAAREEELATWAYLLGVQERLVCL